jgi:hypothetical protein
MSDCKGVINKSNHPIQTPFITQDHKSRQYKEMLQEHIASPQVKVGLSSD